MDTKKRIEKRIPFGFVGDWGKLYKRYTAGVPIETDGDKVIEYDKSYFVDIGMDVQFKSSDKTINENGQLISGLPVDDKTKTAKTTDAYFDDVKKQYVCIVAPDDVVKVFGELWMVEQVATTTKCTPAKQSFYYCKMKNVSDAVYGTPIKS